MVKKHKTLPALLLLVAAVIAPVSADDDADTVQARYRWKEGVVYRYKTTHYRPVNRVENERETAIEVMSSTKGRSTLAIRGPRVIKAQDPFLFVAVNEQGAAFDDSLKVGGDIRAPSPENASFSYALQMSVIPQGYHQGIWELPAMVMRKDAGLTLGKKEYTFRGFSGDDADIATIEVSKRDLPGESREKHVMIFDIKRGLLLEFRHIKEKNLAMAMRLVGSAPLDRDTVTLRKAQLKNALPADRFRMKVFIPLLASPKKSVKRTAFFALKEIRDEGLRTEAYGKAVESVQGNDYFDMFTDWLVSDDVWAGRKWAVKALLAWEIPAWGEALSGLEEISGLKLGQDRKEWKDWLRRIEAVLPEIGETPRERLLAAFGDRDPWVRLFVLKELARREDEDLNAFIKKASADGDKRVRACAATLKEKREKENGTRP
jgi:hypothetical protein